MGNSQGGLLGQWLLANGSQKSLESELFKKGQAGILLHASHISLAFGWLSPSLHAAAATKSLHMLMSIGFSHDWHSRISPKIPDKLQLLKQPLCKQQPHSARGRESGKSMTKAGIAQRIVSGLGKKPDPKPLSAQRLAGWSWTTHSVPDALTYLAGLLWERAWNKWNRVSSTSP